MKVLTAMLLGLCAVAGCAQPPAEPAAVKHLPGIPSRSLVFTPEVALFGPVQEASRFDRTDRDEAAFAGFRSEVVTYNVIRLDDRQRQSRRGNFDRTDRRTISTRVFVQTR
ncbi:MAG: hypothetical protein AAGD32_04680 [Planctomycetota bacterium]